MKTISWLDGLFRGGRRRGGAREGDPEDPRLFPLHVAIIMDGNGRWAAKRRLPALAGHRAGTQAVRRIVEMARDVGLEQLTLYSFSTENWTRSPQEVEGLMKLHVEMIDSEVPTLHENDCRVLFVGRRAGLGDTLKQRMEWAEDLTASNKRMILFIALNYGGRQEIIDAVRRAMAAGEPVEELTEERLAAHLYSPLMREPDLVIRTSGEQRLSNFLLWQTAYSELYFTETLWPDFGREQFQHALDDYTGRERRFGARNNDERGRSDA